MGVDTGARTARAPATAGAARGGASASGRRGTCIHPAPRNERTRGRANLAAAPASAALREPRVARHPPLRVLHMGRASACERGLCGQSHSQSTATKRSLSPTHRRCSTRGSSHLRGPSASRGAWRSRTSLRRAEQSRRVGIRWQSRRVGIRWRDTRTGRRSAHTGAKQRAGGTLSHKDPP